MSGDVGDISVDDLIYMRTPLLNLDGNISNEVQLVL